MPWLLYMTALLLGLAGCHQFYFGASLIWLPLVGMAIVVLGGAFVLDNKLGQLRDAKSLQQWMQRNAPIRQDADGMVEPFNMRLSVWDYTRTLLYVHELAIDGTPVLNFNRCNVDLMRYWLKLSADKPPLDPQQLKLLLEQLPRPGLEVAR